MRDVAFDTLDADLLANRYETVGNIARANFPPVRNAVAVDHPFAIDWNRPADDAHPPLVNEPCIIRVELGLNPCREYREPCANRSRQERQQGCVDGSSDWQKAVTSECVS